MFVELKNIKKVFFNGDKPIEILKGVELRVEKGEKIAIVGPSGSGKTTLLNIIGTIDKPTSGEIFFNGVSIDYQDDEKLSFFRRKKIGFVFQFYHLLPELNVFENLIIPGLIEGLSWMEIERTAKDLLEKLRLLPKRDARVYTLSGGERQKLAIGRALFLKPEILLADEPTGNLDPESAKEIINLFIELNQELKITLILVTHNMEIAKKMDKVYLLKEGFLVEYNKL
ncbi:MAG: ABC transporter ATP-binding protein [Caldimicrobium sp.]